jgi:hypothetical protein
MDQPGNTSQKDHVNQEGGEKMDKLQKELDDLEKRAHEELSKQTPTFAVVEEENNEVKEAVPSATQEDSVSTISTSTDEHEEIASDDIQGKVISAEVVEDREANVQTAQLTPITGQPAETLQVQPNEIDEKQKDPVDANKMTKSIFWVALVLFLITLTAVGAYFVGSRNIPSSTSPTPTPLAVKTPLPTPTPTPSVMSFVNEIYAYSFNYPGTMSMVKDLSTPDEIVTVTENENNLVVYAGSESFTPVSNTKPASESDYVISGITATKEVYTSLYDVYVFPKNESEVNNIVIRYNNGVATSEIENVMTQILASFAISKGEDGEATPAPSATPEATPGTSPTPAGGP